MKNFFSVVWKFQLSSKTDINSHQITPQSCKKLPNSSSEFTKDNLWRPSHINLHSAYVNKRLDKTVSNKKQPKSVVLYGCLYMHWGQ